MLHVISTALLALRPSPLSTVATSRRAVLPLLASGLSLPSLPAFATDGLGVPDEGTINDKFEVKVDGKVRALTEIEARDELTKKVKPATEAGKGIDVNRRGQFNEKALFSEDFYFKYGLRPTPEDLKAKREKEGPPEIPFAPVQRRYTGYKKFEGRIKSGLELYSGGYKAAISDGNWAEVNALLEVGSRSSGSKSDGSGSGVAASELRSSCRAMGLFGNTVLQSENDSGTTSLNLLARHLINELYFSMDDAQAAAKAGDKGAAKEAWTRGRDYLNEYLKIINIPISAKVGDKFAYIEENI